MTPRVRITMNGRTVEGIVLVASTNLVSLIVTWPSEIALRTQRGGMYLGNMALVSTTDSEPFHYVDIIEGDTVELEYF